MLLFLSCKKYFEEHAIGEPINTSVSFSIVEQAIGFYQIKLAYTVSNGLHISTGVISSPDSLSLVQLIQNNTITERPIAETNHIYRITFDRPTEADRMYYAFYIENGDGTVSYKPIARIDFGSFTFTAEGFTDDHNALASLRTFKWWDEAILCDCDFKYSFDGRIDRRETFRVTINGIGVPFNLLLLTENVLEVTVPEHFLSGLHELRLYYDGYEIHYRSFYIPVGRMVVVGTHPRRPPNEPVGYFSQGNAVYFLRPNGGNRHGLEQTRWIPSTGQWTIVDLAASNNIPLSTFFRMEGKVIRNRIYFGPENYWAPWGSEFINQYALRIHEYDPSTNLWDIVELNQEDGSPFSYTEFYPITAETVGDELIIAYVRQDWYSNTPEVAIYAYNPISKTQRKVSDVQVPRFSEQFKLLKSRGNLYLSSFSPEDEEWSEERKYVGLLQELDQEHFRVIAEKTFPTRGAGKLVGVKGDELVILGTSNYPYRYHMFGQVYNISQNTAMYIDPTFSGGENWGIFNFNFMLVHDSRIYLGFDRQGNLIEWDINYKRR